MHNPQVKNISLKTLRQYLEWKGLKHYRINGGHEIWGRSDLNRPITFQTHIDPVPTFIVKQIFRHLKVDNNDFIKFLKS